MTTPTTGTAPLIERLAEAVAHAVADNHGFTYDPSDVMQVILHDDLVAIRKAITAALGDVLVIEREQARETIAEASWEHYEHGEHPAWADLDELAPSAKTWELARADAIIAALRAAPEETR